MRCDRVENLCVCVCVRWGRWIPIPIPIFMTTWHHTARLRINKLIVFPHRIRAAVSLYCDPVLCVWFRWANGRNVAGNRRQFVSFCPALQPMRCARCPKCKIKWKSLAKRGPNKSQIVNESFDNPFGRDFSVWKAAITMAQMRPSAPRIRNTIQRNKYRTNVYTNAARPPLILATSTFNVKRNDKLARARTFYCDTIALKGDGLAGPSRAIRVCICIKYGTSAEWQIVVKYANRLWRIFAQVLLVAFIHYNVLTCPFASSGECGAENRRRPRHHHITPYHRIVDSLMGGGRRGRRGSAGARAPFVCPEIILINTY